MPGGSSSHALHPGKFGFSSSAQNEAESASMQPVQSGCTQHAISAIRVPRRSPARAWRMRALKRRVCCAPPTSVYRSRRISGSVSSTTRASYLHAISRNQSQSETHLGEGDHTSRVGRTAEIGAPAGSIKGNQGRSHLGDRTLASAGRTAEIGAPAGSTALTRASAEPAAALAPS